MFAELYLVQDKSPDFQNTWRFLENRLNDAYQMAKVSSTVCITFMHNQLLIPRSCVRQHLGEYRISD